MKVLKYVICSVLFVGILGSAAAAYAAWHNGYRAYAVRTGSMTPTYPTGALVIDAPVTDVVGVGDVITFQTPDGLVTHRVHDVLSQGLRTQGDGNRTTDAWTVAPDRVVGVVSWGAAYLGYVLVFFQQPTGAPALVLLCLSIWFAWSLFFPAKESSEAAESVPAAVTMPVKVPLAVSVAPPSPADDPPALIVLPGAEKAATVLPGDRSRARSHLRSA